MPNTDHQLTKKLRALGEPALAFWKHIAARGMWIFLLFWGAIVVSGWMVWWKPILPLVLSYITLLVTQAIVKRERQNFEKISGYKMWIRTYSFPSGHATESAVFALTLALYPTYPTVLLATIFFCALAILAGCIMYSRIVVGVHYVADVVAGALLGSLYALAFLRVLG